MHRQQQEVTQLQDRLTQEEATVTGLREEMAVKEQHLRKLRQSFKEVRAENWRVTNCCQLLSTPPLCLSSILLFTLCDQLLGVVLASGEQEQSAVNWPNMGVNGVGPGHVSSFICSLMADGFSEPGLVGTQPVTVRPHEADGKPTDWTAADTGETSTEGAVSMLQGVAVFG